MKSKKNINRRNAIKTIALGSGALAMPKVELMTTKEEYAPLKGNINHSVCQWCFNDIPLETLAQEAQKMGLVGIDLIGAEGWDTLKKYKLTSTMCYGDLEGISTRNLTNGWCDLQFHEDLIKHYKRFIPMVAEAGWTNLICFSGNRRGIDDKTGLENCVKGLKEILPLAAQHGVVLHMELLNSKVNHADYMCDNSPWGVALCEALNSDNFKLLYDIYHMQIMEGDLAPTMQNNIKQIAHVQLADNPGRHEPGTGEINYPFVLKHLDDIGYQGWVGCEYKPETTTLEGLGWLNQYR